VRQLALIAGGQRCVPAVCDLLAEGGAAAGHLLHIVIAARPLRVVRHGAVHPLARDVEVVDIAAVVIAVARQPDRRPVLDERYVDEALDRAVVSTAVDLADIGIYAGAEPAGIRLVGDEAHRSGHGAGAEGRALRAVQHFDALDIIEMQIGRHAIEVHRHIVDQERGGGLVGIIRVAAVGHAAHDQRLSAWTRADEGNRRGLRGIILELRDREVLKILAREDVDADRHVLQVFRALARGHDHLFQGGVRGRIRRAYRKGMKSGCSRQGGRNGHGKLGRRKGRRDSPPRRCGHRTGR